MSKPAAERMAAEEFDRVAATCRWSARSLNVARALLVDGRDPAGVAAENEMTANQAGVLKRRFQGKATEMSLKKLTAADFMQVVKPESELALKPFRRELAQLVRNGYTTEQLRVYLAENGIEITDTALDQYLTKANIHANSRNSK